MSNGHRGTAPPAEASSVEATVSYAALMASGADGVGDAGVFRLVLIAVIASITQISLTIAFTSLTFRDGLVDDLELGLAAMFSGLLIAAVVGGIRSGLAGHVVGPQDSGLVVLSVVAPSIALATEAAGETIVVLMGLSSVGVGITLLLLGRFGLGRSVRYLPYPVLAGFLAGTGLVMARSSFELAWQGISGAATGGGDRAARLVVAGGVSVAMLLVARSPRPTERLMPTLVLGSLALIHAGRAVDGMGRVEGADRGWLLPKLPEGSLITSDYVNSGASADWSVVVERLPDLLPLLILAPLTLLLYLGALEAVLDVDLDTDREFRVIGSVNLIAGAAGSAPSYTQFANSLLVQRMVGRERAVPVLIGLSAIVVLFTGDTVVALVPQPLVAGMLGFIAASFVLDWTWDLRHRVSVAELGLALVIAATIPAFGFLAGIGLGLLLTAGWFVVQYSRSSGVRRIADATGLRSKVARPPEAHELLRRHGDSVVVVELDGFLFFGIGDSVTRSILALEGLDRVRWVVLDFERVTGADSSAVAAFGPLLRWADRTGTELIWCGVRSRVERALSPLLDDARSGRVAIDLDRALESTEEAILGEALTDAGHGPADVELDAIRAYATVVEHAPGAAILTEGERGPGLLVIERGQASVLGAAPGARRQQLGPGSVLGDIGIYLDEPSSATVVATEPCTVLVLRREDLERIELEDAPAAIELHRRLAAVLADRLLSANDEIDTYRAPGVDR